VPDEATPARQAQRLTLLAAGREAAWRHRSPPGSACPLATLPQVIPVTTSGLCIFSMSKALTDFTSTSPRSGPRAARSPRTAHSPSSPRSAQAVEPLGDARALRPPSPLKHAAAAGLSPAAGSPSGERRCDTPGWAGDCADAQPQVHVQGHMQQQLLRWGWAGLGWFLLGCKPAHASRCSNICFAVTASLITAHRIPARPAGRKAGTAASPVCTIPPPEAMAPTCGSPFGSSAQQRLGPVWGDDGSNDDDEGELVANGIAQQPPAQLGLEDSEPVGAAGQACEAAGAAVGAAPAGGGSVLSASRQASLLAPLAPAQSLGLDLSPLEAPGVLAEQQGGGLLDGRLLIGERAAPGVHMRAWHRWGAGPRMKDAGGCKRATGLPGSCRAWALTMRRCACALCLACRRRGRGGLAPHQAPPQQRGHGPAAAAAARRCQEQPAGPGHGGWRPHGACTGWGGACSGSACPAQWQLGEKFVVNTHALQSPAATQSLHGHSSQRAVPGLAPCRWLLHPLPAPLRPRSAPPRRARCSSSPPPATPSAAPSGRCWRGWAVVRDPPRCATRSVPAPSMRVCSTCPGSRGAACPAPAPSSTDTPPLGLPPCLLPPFPPSFPTAS